jgi:hypothetical protein
MQNDLFKAENKYPLEQEWKLREDENVFGKGFSINLFKLVTENDISCVNFLISVNEGDNTIDSEMFLNRLNKYLQILPKGEKLAIPCSWKYLFGNESTVDVY